MIFWGAQNIAGESSLKIPYSTKAVKVNFEKLSPTQLMAHIYGLLFELFWPQNTFYFKKSLQSKTAVIFECTVKFGKDRAV